MQDSRNLGKARKRKVQKECGDSFGVVGTLRGRSENWGK